MSSSNNSSNNNHHHQSNSRDNGDSNRNDGFKPHAGPSARTYASGDDLMQVRDKWGQVRWKPIREVLLGLGLGQTQGQQPSSSRRN